MYLVHRKLKWQSFIRNRGCIFLNLIIILLFNCNKLPLGEDELEVRGGFATDTLRLEIFVSSTEFKNIPVGTSQNLVLGKNDIYESRILLKFNFPDTTYSGLDEIKLTLYRNTLFRFDTISIGIYLLNSDFTEGEATWYEKSNTEPWQNPGGDFEIDSLRFCKVNGDSLIVWFNYIDLSKIMNSKGLILIPHSDGFCFFHSREGGKAPTFKVVKNGVVNGIPLGSDCHIIKADTTPNYWEDWLGSGVVYRNYVKFNYDTTLDSSKAIFGELTFDLEHYFSYRDSVEIGVKYLIKPFTGFDSELGPQIALKKFSLKDSKFSLDIVRYIQRIIDHPDSNFGFFIYLSPENYDITNIKLIKGSHNLKVGFIRPPQER